MGKRERVLSLAVGWLLLASGPVLAQEKKASEKAKVPPVVAKVNGKSIKAEQYNRLWTQFQMDPSRKAAREDPGKQEAMKQDALDHLIKTELLLQKADQMKIQAGAEEVDKRIQEVQSRMGGEGALKEALKGHGLTMEEYRTEVGRSLKLHELLQKEIFGKVTVDPKEAKDFYESNPASFQVPEQVKARHILVRVPDGATEAQKKEAKQAIDKAAERIKKGEAFEEVAKQVSQDTTASAGGDLGYFSKGQMVPEFENTAFSLDKGKVSPVVETKFGYHLIKAEDKRPAGTLSFEEVSPKLEEFLKRRKGEEALNAYVEDLRSKAKIEKTQF